MTTPVILIGSDATPTYNENAAPVVVAHGKHAGRGSALGQIHGIRYFPTFLETPDNAHGLGGDGLLCLHVFHPVKGSGVDQEEHGNGGLLDLQGRKGRIEQIGTPEDLPLLLPYADFWKADRATQRWAMSAVRSIRERWNYDLNGPIKKIRKNP